MLSHQTEENVDVINDANETIDTVPRSVAYAKHLSHRIVHVMVVDEDKVYLVRRSKAVRYLPGFFCTSAGGHVAAGESSMVGALREMREEIGLEGPIELVHQFSFTHDFRVQISLYLKFFNPVKERLSLNPGEVMSGDFYSESEASALKEELLHPQLKPCLDLCFEFLRSRK